MAYVAADKKLTITLDTSLTGAAYAVKVAGVKDKAYVPNTMDEATLTFTVADSTVPTLSKALVNAARTKIRVYFSEPMSTEGLTTIGNYYYILDAAAVAPMPDNSTVAIVDTKTVEITLGTALAATFVAGGNDKVVVSGSLKDTTGNALGGLYKDVATTGDDIVAANITKAQFNSLTNVTFEVDRELSSIDVTKFTIDGTADSVTAATYVNGSGISTVTLTVDTAKEDVKTELSGIGTANAIVITASGLTSTFGTANSGVVNVTKATTTDKILPTLDAQETMDADINGKINHVKLTYSEAMDIAYISADKFTVTGYTVTDAFPATIAPTGTGRTGATVVSGTTVYVVITEGSTADTGAVPTITISGSLKDANGNAYAGLATATATTDKAAPVLLSAAINYKNGGTADFGTDVGDDLVLTYSEKVYASSTGWTDAAPTQAQLDAQHSHSLVRL